jgi:hypothetical protein
MWLCHLCHAIHKWEPGNYPTIDCVRLITVSKSWTEIRTPHNKKYGSAKQNGFGQFLKDRF